MKKVFVYTSECKVVETYKDYIEQIKYPPLEAFSYQAGEIFSQEQLSFERINLPIKQFNRELRDGSIETRYAAFDRQLLEFFGCLEDQKCLEIQNAVDKATKPLHTQIQKYENMTFWQRLKWSFKK